ncbi:MAG: LysR family transcriptional regulator [Bdellovibrionales bacterium]|nr:LysR family transcriptional regulator [Bdellovibrionales bacterium]
METFELRYFLGVARTQNIHQASEELHVSPGSLSKAIARLEEELNVKLFSREGRNIRLNEQGRLLQRRASEIIQLEEATRLELSGATGSIQVQIAGAEILLSNWGVNFSQTIKKKYPLAQFTFLATNDEAALEKVIRGEAHIAIVTSDIPVNSELSSKTLGETMFKTYLGKGHPLYAQAKNKKSVQMEELLKHAFVSPSHPLLGKVGQKQSLDGWRDDYFPRKVEYLTSSLKILEELVVSGKAIAYLPEYFGKGLNLEMIKVVGCPYTCNQKIKIVARNPKDLGWLNQIF